MAEVDELPFRLRAFIRMYPWRSLDPVPWNPMKKPIRDANIAIVSTAGFIAPGQAPFDSSVKGGDFTFRTIASDVDVRTLVDAHRSHSFDHAGVHADPNLAFPLDRFHELARDRHIGSVNRRHWSFMGSITAPGRLISRSAPEAAQQAVDDRVDVALLVPV
jgi:D-proline reductase (dithiol) PrdB